jgi:hypothetical protein
LKPAKVDQARKSSRASVNELLSVGKHNVPVCGVVQNGAPSVAVVLKITAIDPEDVIVVGSDNSKWARRSIIPDRKPLTGLHWINYIRPVAEALRLDEPHSTRSIIIMASVTDVRTAD